MIILKILLVFLGALFVLLLIPIRVLMIYRNEFCIRLHYLFFRYTYPGKKTKIEKQIKPEKKGKKHEKKNTIRGILQEKGFHGFINFLKEITGISGRAVRMVIHRSFVTLLHVTVIVGGEDAASTALQCGYISTVVYPAVGWLTTLTSVRKLSVNIYPDYDAKKSKADLRLQGFVWPIVILWAALVALLRYTVLIVKKRIKEPIKQGGVEIE